MRWEVWKGRALVSLGECGERECLVFIFGSLIENLFLHHTINLLIEFIS